MHVKTWKNLKIVYYLIVLIKILPFLWKIIWGNATKNYYKALKIALSVYLYTSDFNRYRYSLNNPRGHPPFEYKKFKL